MSVLAKIKRGGDDLPPRITFSGPEGIGKSTFAAQAPNPVFIAPEDGLTGLEHVQRLPSSSFSEILALCAELLTGEHDFKTLVIDTTDWLERAIHAFICKRDSKENIEAYGYGKGYKIAEAELVVLLNALDALRQRRKMGIILLSHVHIRTFVDPSGESWDRYEMKGHKGFTGILREWPDACLFAVYEVFKTKDKGTSREKTIGGDRIIHTSWSPGWDAKNRLGLPPTLPMPEGDSYGPFARAVAENSPTKLREEYLTLLKTADLSADSRAKWEKVDVLSLDPSRVRNGIEKLRGLQKAA